MQKNPEKTFSNTYYTIKLTLETKMNYCSYASDRPLYDTRSFTIRKTLLSTERERNTEEIKTETEWLMGSHQPEGEV